MKWIWMILALLTASFCRAQDTVEIKKKWSIYGYIKNLESLSFDKNFENSISGNLLHQRLNVKWKPSDIITATAEFRNRFFWGEEIKSIPGFAEQLRNDNEATDLQKAWIQKPYMVLHTNVERLNIEYREARWNLRVGRQRINWGITTTWNPNDIFNTYNFLDFDYEERPGVDGVKFQYIFQNSSHTEIAYIYTGKEKGHVAAGKYSFNHRGYDFQLITGWYKDQITLGAGWAGNIKEAGFKSEMQYFLRKKDSLDHFNLSLEGDYIFKSGWYASIGFLYNKNGLDKSLETWDHLNLRLSPENPMPTKWNFIATTAKEITPLFSVNMSVLYAAGTDLIILLPSFKYNLATNLDADLIWQSFFAKLDQNFEAVNHRCFVRLKWSF